MMAKPGLGIVVLKFLNRCHDFDGKDTDLLAHLIHNRLAADYSAQFVQVGRRFAGWLVPPWGTPTSHVGSQASDAAAARWRARDAMRSISAAKPNSGKEHSFELCNSGGTREERLAKRL